MENRGAIILAAGYSSRMGDFKPLMPVGDVSAVERLIASVKKAGIRTIVVVTGYNREAMREILEKEGVTEEYNADFQQGMFSSIKAGLQTLACFNHNDLHNDNDCGTDLDGCFLMPVDCPLIPSEVFQMIGVHQNAFPESFVVPCFKGKKGHPLWIPSKYIHNLLSYEGDDGLKGAMKPYSDKIVRLETDCEGVVLDMDTREGYQDVLTYLEKGNRMQSKTGFKGRLFLVRHGETEKHAEKIFMGQVDIPLEAEGRHQALNAGLQLSDYDINTDKIYASDLSRTSETASIISTSIGLANDGKILEVVLEKDFRELNLGDWDGRFIREIREEFAEEYEKRGQNLLDYKRGNEGENYYDLQYRVMKRLSKILEAEAAIAEKDGKERDIVIVSHTGVIRVILANLLGYELSDAITIDIPRGAVVSIEIKNKA